MKENKKIKCDVNSCKHNDCKNNDCNLKEIKITSLNEDDSSKKETICDSFCEKNK